jgi:hypothetical protein
VSKATQIFLYFQAFRAVFLALFASQCKDSHIDAPTAAPPENGALLVKPEHWSRK